MTLPHLLATRRHVLLGLAATALPVPAWAAPPDGVAEGRDTTPDEWGIAQGVDQTDRIAEMLDWASDTRSRVVWPDGGDYWLTGYENTGKAVYANWHCDGVCTLRSLRDTPADDDSFIRLSGQTVTNASITTSVPAGATEIEVTTTRDIQPGHLALIGTTKTIDTDSRGQARDGIVLRVEEVLSPTRVRLSDALPFPITIGMTDGVITARDGAAFQAEGLEIDASDARHAVRFTSGAAQDETARIVTYDPERRMLGTHSANNTVPDGVAVGDTFVIDRKAGVLFSAPAFVAMSGLVFTRAEHRVSDPRKDVAGFVGLSLLRASGAVLDRVAVSNFSSCGIRTIWCYGTDMTNLRLSGANRAFDTFDGTGYGLSITQSSFGRFVDITGHRCRRLVDLGGTQGVSWNNILRDITASGGGVAFGGDAFWPEGDQLVEVAGSHGGAAGTLYQNISGHDVQGVLNIRGLNETARGLYGRGRMDRMILMQYGGSGLVASDIRYEDGVTELGPADTARNYDADADWLNRRLRTIVLFRTDNYGKTRLSRIDGVQANGVQQAVFLGAGGRGTVDNLVYGDIVVTTDNEGGAFKTFHLFGGQAEAGERVIALNAPVILDSPTFPKDRIVLNGPTP